MEPLASNIRKFLRTDKMKTLYDILKNNDIEFKITGGSVHQLLVYENSGFDSEINDIDFFCPLTISSPSPTRNYDQIEHKVYDIIKNISKEIGVKICQENEKNSHGNVYKLSFSNLSSSFDDVYTVKYELNGWLINLIFPVTTISFGEYDSIKILNDKDIDEFFIDYIYSNFDLINNTFEYDIEIEQIKNVYLSKYMNNNLVTQTYKNIVAKILETGFPIVPKFASNNELDLIKLGSVEYKIEKMIARLIEKWDRYRQAPGFEYNHMYRHFYFIYYYDHILSFEYMKKRVIIGLQNYLDPLVYTDDKKYAEYRKIMRQRYKELMKNFKKSEFKYLTLLKNNNGFSEIYESELTNIRKVIDFFKKIDTEKELK